MLVPRQWIGMWCAPRKLTSSGEPAHRGFGYHHCLTFSLPSSVQYFLRPTWSLQQTSVIEGFE